MDRPGFIYMTVMGGVGFFLWLFRFKKREPTLKQQIMSNVILKGQCRSALLRSKKM